MRKQFSCLFIISFLSILFIFVIVSVSFSVSVNNFADLNMYLQSYSEEKIDITTLTIMSTGNYTSCNGSKAITGATGGSILNGNGFSGISSSFGSSQLHLNNITICNFKKVSQGSYGSINNGAGLYFNNNSRLYFDGEVNIISNTISGGGSSFDLYGGDGGGLCIVNSLLFASSVTINFIANKSSDASGAALYFNGSEVNFLNDKIVFQDNEAGDEGAALWAWNNAYLYFTNPSVTFLRNKADMIATYG